MKLKRLSRTFFARNTHVVAKELLGTLIVREFRNKRYIARICEVESYVGEDDKASHASPRKRTAFSRGRRGHTPRTEIMYGEVGHAYIYFIYGMYNMLNVVTEKKDFPAAILIRGAIPAKNITHSIDGPGKLTRALHIDQALNKEDLTISSRLYFADDGFRVSKDDIHTSPRIGVDYAGEDALLPWRYFVELSEHVGMLG